MDVLVALTGKGLILILSALTAIVVLRLLTGGIRLSGLLRDTSQEHGFSPARLQLLIFTLAAVGEYLSLMMRRPEGGGLPALSGGLVQFLGASQVFYAGSKTWQRLVLPWVDKIRKGDR